MEQTFQSAAAQPPCRGSLQVPTSAKSGFAAADRNVCPTANKRLLASSASQSFGISRIFAERQAHAADEVLVGPQVRRRVVAGDAGGGDDVVLVDAVAGDAEAAHNLARLVDRSAAGEEDDAVLVREARRGVEIGADVERIETDDRRVRRRW